MSKSKKWEESQKLTARVYSGTVTPASGSGSSLLDVIAGGPYKGFRIENKFTEGGSISLSKTIVKKARLQAASMGTQYFLVFEIEDHPKNIRMVCLEESLFTSLFERGDL